MAHARTKVPTRSTELLRTVWPVDTTRRRAGQTLRECFDRANVVRMRRSKDRLVLNNERVARSKNAYQSFDCVEHRSTTECFRGARHMLFAPESIEQTHVEAPSHETVRLRG